jgi:outer membrane protein assembly factor BamB
MSTRHPWTAVGIIAMLFAVVVAAGLLANQGQRRAADPLKAGDLTALKAELALSPKDEALKERIRVYDASVRSAWFTHEAIAQRGAWLLLAGVVVAIGALKLARRIEDRPYDPRGRSTPDVVRAAAHGRWGVAIGGLVLFGGLLALGGGDAEGPAVPPSVPTIGPPPGAAVIARNWPNFRGPAAGLAQGPAATSWDAAAGTNLRWQTTIPLPGFNSSVVWEGSVYLTGSDGARQEVYAIDADSGAIRWTCAIPVPAGAKLEPFEATGFAAPSPATDGRCVVVLFATGSLAAVSPEGRILWSKSLGVPDSQYALAASPVIWRDRVLVQLDQGSEADGKSALIAFDLASGRELWRSRRPTGSTWASPVVADLAGRSQILACGSPHLIAYDPATGAELWRAACLGGEIAPSPAIAGGTVIVANDSAQIACLRPDGSGDVTATHLVWSGTDGLPDSVSPVADAELVAMLSPGGLLTCLDAKTGAKLWEHEFAAQFTASLIVAGGRLYATKASGLTHIVAWAREFAEIGSGSLGEEISTTPAIVGGRIFLRGKTSLFCIEARP